MLLDDLKKLEADAMALEPIIEQFIAAGSPVLADLEAIATDLGVTIPQLFEPHGLAGASPEKSQATAAIAATFDGHRIKALICMSIPIYNLYALTKGWPQVPTPSWCATTGAVKDE